MSPPPPCFVLPASIFLLSLILQPSSPCFITNCPPSLQSGGRKRADPAMEALTAGHRTYKQVRGF